MTRWEGNAMTHPSPYELLSVLDQPHTSLSSPVRSVSSNDLHMLAERWKNAYAHPAPSPAMQPHGSLPVSQSKGPMLRTPPPMYPPTAYPTGVPSYNASPQSTRHAYYDSILQQHRNAAKRAIFVEGPLEHPQM
jgi:hypothetical protein